MLFFQKPINKIGWPIQAIVYDADKKTGHIGPIFYSLTLIAINARA